MVAGTKSALTARPAAIFDFSRGAALIPYEIVAARKCWWYGSIVNLSGASDDKKYYPYAHVGSVHDLKMVRSVHNTSCADTPPSHIRIGR